jgi:hypothetical protein
MSRRRVQRSTTELRFPEAERKGLPSVPAAAALSFLKDTRGLATWTACDVANSLNITLRDAQQVIAVLEVQGYVKPARANEWMTTLSGEEVSGSKPPRYTHERVEKALAELRRRIVDINRDSVASYKITEAVAFGGFLCERPRVQSAEVGIRLAGREPGEADSDSAKKRAAQREFLRQLQARASLLHIRPFEKWMSVRTHRSLI